MPPEPTAKLHWKLVLDVNRVDGKTLDMLERYADPKGEMSELPSPWYKIFSQYSKEDIREAVGSERVFRESTLDDWLEIARDFYQDATGTKRRPKLLEDEFVAYLRLEAKYGSGDNGFKP